MVDSALTLEDLGVEYDSSDQSSYSMDSTTKTKAALIDIYSQFYREVGFRVCIKKEKRIMVVDTVNIQRLVSLKFPSDVIIFPKHSVENELVAPHTLFRVIVGYDAPSVAEMILGMMNFESEETKKTKPPRTVIKKKEEIADFDSVRTGKVNYKKLPFIIIFNGCDLFDIDSANEFCKQWEGLISIIWCNSSSQDALKEAYSEDKFQKLKKEKEKMSAENAVLKEGFINILVSQNKKIIEVLNENSVRTAALIEEERKKTAALIEEERKKTIGALESLFEKQLQELRRLMN